MSEKDNEKNIFEKLADEGTEDVETATVPEISEEKAEDGNWEFDSAPSLDDTFLSDLGNDDLKAEVIEDDASAAKESEEKDETKENENIHIPKKAVKIAACVAAGLVVLAVLAFFGVRYFTVPNSDEKMNPGNVALKVSDTPVSIGMYNYYYDSIVYEYTYYANYGYYDLDTTADFATQYTKDDDGNEISWLDFFEQQTKERLKLNIYYYEQGVKAGIELTEDQKSNIDQQISSLETTAAQSGQSINEYISENYGAYCGEATLRKFLEQYYIAGTYYYQSQIINRPSEEDVNAYFEENKDNYKSVSYAMIETAYDTTDDTTKAADVKKAQELCDSFSDVASMKAAIPTASADLVESYISAGYFSNEEDAIAALEDSMESTQSKTDVESTFSTEVADWLFSDDTAVNSAMVYPNDESAIITIIMKTSEPVLDETEVYSVRHILIMPKTEEETTTDEETGEEVAAEATEADWEKAYEDAQSILDEYNNGDKTELSFAKLAEEFSEDTGSTSAGQQGYYGGGYEGTQLGNMVSEFENWATDDSRRYGDVEIVKSEHGYHIMYFIFNGAEYLYNAQLDCAQEAEDKTLSEIKVKNKAGFKKVKVAKPGDSAVAVASSGQ